MLRINLIWEQLTEILILVYTFQKDLACIVQYLTQNSLRGKLVSLFLYTLFFTLQAPKLPSPKRVIRKDFADRGTQT